MNEPDVARPYGHLHPCPLVIICRDSNHRRRMIDFFPVLGAMYLLPGARIGGSSFQRVVVFRPVANAADSEEFDDWLRSTIGTRMAPGRQHAILFM